MSKLGTCRWAYQIQERWILPNGLTHGLDYSHPHSPPAKETHETLPESYTCQWLDQYGHDTLPPALKRFNGGFHIRADDCDVCPHYAPAGSWQPRR